jgi:tetratricopeptide (TPR) repeat protein
LELKCRTELSKIYQQQKKWDDAIRLLKEYIEIDPNGLHPRTELSRIYQQQKRWKEAEDILFELLHLNPRDLLARTELSRVYQQEKRWKEAENILLESLRIDPEQLHARTELSRIYQQQKKWGDAIRVLREYIKIDPDGLHPRTELSRIYQRHKRWKEAEEILQESLRIDPEQRHSRTELSRVYQQQQRWKEAEDILLELLQIDSQDLQARTELSKIYQKHGRWKEAEDLLNECIAINPRDVNSLLELGRVCFHDPARLNEAEQFFHRILEVEPTNLFAKIELANLYRRLKRYGPRETLLFEIYKTDRDDIPTLMALAQVFRRFRKYRVALKLLEGALALRPSDLITISELITTHMILRSNEQVRQYYSKGAKIINADAYNKHSEHFNRIELRLDDQTTLLNLNEIGVCTREDGRRCIESKEIKYLIDEQATINNKVKAGDRVFFATYRKNGEIIADFVEPYFDSLEDLYSLR